MGDPVPYSLFILNNWWLIWWLSDWRRPWSVTNRRSYGATLGCPAAILWPSARTSESDELDGWRTSYGYQCTTRVYCWQRQFSFDRIVGFSDPNLHWKRISSLQNFTYICLIESLMCHVSSIHCKYTLKKVFLSVLGN